MGMSCYRTWIMGRGRADAIGPVTIDSQYRCAPEEPRKCGAEEVMTSSQAGRQWL